MALTALKWGAIAIIVIITAVGIYDYKETKARLEAKKAEVMIMSDKIKTQNDAIEALKLDVEVYKNKKPQIIEKIVTKYENIQVKDDTCEAKLEAIYEAQKLFFDSVNKTKNPLVKEKNLK